MGVASLCLTRVQTGYDARGGMHFAATEGLSPYIEWLHRTLRHRQVRRLLHPLDLATIDAKLSRAKAWLERLHLRGRITYRELQEMHAIGLKVEAALLALVPSDHPLYPAIFPMRDLVEAFETEIRAGGDT